MSIREHLKTAIWGMAGGGIAAIAIGFTWGGWITAGTAGQMERASAEEAIVLAFTPLCVSKAEQQIDKLAALKDVNSWKQGDFVVESGWVDNVSDYYRDDVAKVCASTLIEGMNTG